MRLYVQSCVHTATWALSRVHRGLLLSCSAAAVLQNKAGMGVVPPSYSVYAAQKSGFGNANDIPLGGGDDGVGRGRGRG